MRGHPTKAAAINLVKSFEGFVPSLVPAPIGIPPSVSATNASKQIASKSHRLPSLQAIASQPLSNDDEIFVSCPHKLIKPSATLNDNRFGAPTGFVFLGCGKIQHRLY
ncbi:glycoside hydrolase family 24 protein [Sphaerobolus stellatus SS14]|nr:glycoside hydrolase family 24 protein [Sphaerobolus stellatus SS14]